MRTDIHTSSPLRSALIAGTILAVSVGVAGAPAGAVTQDGPTKPSTKWRESKRINDPSVDAPQAIVTDARYRLVANAVPGAASGTVALYDAAGKNLDTIKVGFQPSALVSVGQSTFWVSNNNGTIKELKRRGAKLSLTGKQKKLGDGFSSSLTRTGPSLLTGLVSNNSVVTIATYNFSTGKLVVVKRSGHSIPGDYATLAGGVLYTVFGSGSGGAVMTGFDPVTLKVVKRVPVATASQGMVADKAGNVWMANSAAGTLTKYAAGSMRPVQTVKLPASASHYPLGVAYCAAANLLAVSMASDYVDSSGVVFVSAAAGKVVVDAKISGDYPSAVTFTSSSTLWAANLRHRAGDNPGGSISILTNR